MSAQSVNLDDLTAYQRGLYYIDQKDWHNAIWEFEEAMLDDDDLEANCMFYRARCKQEMGDYAGALIDFAIALDRDCEYKEEIYVNMNLLRDYYEHVRGIKLPERQQSILNAAV